MSRFIKDIKKYSKYMGYAAKSGLKSEVAGSHLGWIWWVLEPFMFMLVYWFIFAVMFDQSAKFYPIFVFIGLTLWNFFNKNLLDSVKIVNNNKAIVSKVYVPKFTLIMIEMLMQSFKMGISFLIVIGMMIFYQVPISFYILWFIPVMITLFLISFGLNCIVAHFGVFVEDLKTVLTVGLRILFYLSGVFYALVPSDGSPSRVPQPWADILTKCNPLAFLMNSCRESLIYASNVHYIVLGAWFVVGLLLSVIGVRTIYKYENSYVKVI